MPYESPCKNLHGHNWKIEVVCQAEGLDGAGMVVDFAKIKKAVNETFDHKYINNVMVGKTQRLKTLQNLFVEKFLIVLKL